MSHLKIILALGLDWFMHYELEETEAEPIENIDIIDLFCTRENTMSNQ